MNIILSTEQIEIEKGWSVEIEVIPIIDGVTLKVYDGEQAELLIGNNAIEFAWTSEAKELFENIDTVETIELLELLNRLQVF